MKRTYLAEIVKAYEEMPDLKGASTAKFDYFASKNARIAEQELEHRRKCLKPSEGWKAFEQEREAIYRKHCVKDASGQPELETRTFNGQTTQFYKLPEDRSGVDADFTALVEKYKTEIETRDKALVDFERMMNEDFTEDELKMFHRIKLEDCPAIGKTMRIWEPLIDA